MEDLRLIIYIDGASRGNPGPAGIGIAVSGLKGESLAEESVFIGETTNNVAEYRALLAALKKAKEMGARSIQVMTDSELLFRQMRGLYRVRSPKLIALFQEVVTRVNEFADFELQHVPRAANRKADRLANHAIDAWMRGLRCEASSLEPEQTGRAEKGVLAEGER